MEFIQEKVDQFETKTNLDVVNCTSLIFGLLTVLIISYLIYKTWKYIKNLHYIVDYVPILKEYFYNVPELNDFFEYTKELNTIPHYGNIFIFIRLFFPILMVFGIMVMVLSIASIIKNNSEDISVTDQLIVATIVISFIFIFIILRLLLTFKTPTILIPYFFPDIKSKINSKIESIPSDYIESKIESKIGISIPLDVKTAIKSKMTPQNKKKLNSQIIKGFNKIKSKLKHYKKKAFLLDIDNRCMSNNNELNEMKDFVFNVFGFDENILKSFGKNAFKTIEKTINIISEDENSNILEILTKQKVDYIKSLIRTSKLSVNVLLVLGIIYFISMINLYSRR